VGIGWAGVENGGGGGCFLMGIIDREIKKRAYQNMICPLFLIS
jgi:hypothetical protein